MELDTIVCGDCLDVMADMPRECVDLLVADPPYDLGYWDWVDGWLEIAKEVLKPSGSIYVFCGIGEKSDSLSRMLPIVKEHFTFKNLITWKKQRGYGTQRNWMHTREEIIFAVNGVKHTFNPQYTIIKRKRYGFKDDSGRLWEDYCKSDYKRASNVWIDIGEISSIIGDKQEWLGTNVTQKPEALLKRIILASSNKGNLVFDPFMGTGTTAKMALLTNRLFHGCDIDSKQVNQANERIEKTRLEMAQMELGL